MSEKGKGLEGLLRAVSRGKKTSSGQTLEAYSDPDAIEGWVGRGEEKQLL